MKRQEIYLVSAKEKEKMRMINFCEHLSTFNTE